MHYGLLVAHHEINQARIPIQQLLRSRSVIRISGGKKLASRFVLLWKAISDTKVDRSNCTYVLLDSLVHCSVVDRVKRGPEKALATRLMSSLGKYL